MMTTLIFKKKIPAHPIPSLVALKAAPKVATLDHAKVIGGKVTKAKARRQALIDLVREIVSNDPLQFDGHSWAARTQEWYAAKLGTCVSTIRNYIKAPPFVRDRVLIGDQTLAIVRVGEPDAKSERHIANTLKLIFLDHIQWLHKNDMLHGMTPFKTLSPADYGRLIGLAKAWPAGQHEALFRFVLTNWPLFMSAVHYAIDMANIEAEGEGKPKPFKKNYYKVPTIRVMRLFPDSAIEAYEGKAAGIF